MNSVINNYFEKQGNNNEKHGKPWSNNQQTVRNHDKLGNNIGYHEGMYVYKKGRHVHESFDNGTQS